jgi:hypothetical protein
MGFGPISIDTAAWQAHQAHGDTIAACPVLSCQSGFGILSSSPAKDTILTAGSPSVTFTAVASKLTYGVGGPAIPVTVSYSTDGVTWTDLFHGNAIGGGETQTVNLAADARLAVRMHAYFKKHGWLTYDVTHDSNDKTGYSVQYLNGQNLPDIAGYNGNPGIRTLLSSYIDGQSNFNIGTSKVMLTTELGTCLSCASADFQDADILLTFSAPYCQ